MQWCNADAWVKTIRKYAELETLTKDVLIELIDKIEVFEAEKIDGQRICRINIAYRYVGDIGIIPDMMIGGERLDEAV